MAFFQKIFIALLSLGIMVGVACAQSGSGVRTADHPGKIPKKDAWQIGYGLKMNQNEGYEGYCDGSNGACVQHQKNNKMSHRERQMLRKQVDDAGKTLYSRQHH